MIGDVVAVFWEACCGGQLRWLRCRNAVDSRCLLFTSRLKDTCRVGIYTVVSECCLFACLLAARLHITSAGSHPRVECRSSACRRNP